MCEVTLVKSHCNELLQLQKVCLIKNNKNKTFLCIIFVFVLFIYFTIQLDGMVIH